MRIFARTCLASTVFVAIAASQAAQASSKPVEPAATICPNDNQPINENRFVRIGGIEQWVTIRGRSCANPVILFLHGGPGNPLSPYAEAIYPAWEKEFTLVQWDQRGAGKTFGRNSDQANLTIDRMTGDGTELATYLIAQLGQPKVILVAGSWGSVLGVHMAKARPDLFHAYLGVGQLVSYGANQEASYEQTIALADGANDSATLAALKALGPPPWTNPRGFGTLRRATRIYEAKTATPAPANWWKPSAAYATPAALADYEGGEDFSYLQFVGLAGDGMLSKVDLPGLGSNFLIPFFLVQGSEDLVTVPAVAKSYFDSLSAPQKQYLLVPSAGHDPNTALIDAQYEILKLQIRPLAH